MSMYTALRPALFALPPERAHRLAIHLLNMRFGTPSEFHHPALVTRIGDLVLPNPVGLAAGFDKNAECYAACLAAGFGFVEIGTVTPRAQAGNLRPRLFRLVEDEAVINRLGFNNHGVVRVARRLAKRGEGIIGGNIGKNKDTTDAVADYLLAMRALYPHVDYITANISSPNTPGLRDLQHTEALRALIHGLHSERTLLIEQGEARKPVFIKIAPDNDAETLDAIAEAALDTALDGLIVSNTTLARTALRSPLASEAGGLSGKPLMPRSTEVLRHLFQRTGGKIPLIGVGGIASATDAYAKIRAGACAVQLYTALIYQGIGLVEEINRRLVHLLARDGFSSVEEAVGRDFVTKP